LGADYLVIVKEQKKLLKGIVDMRNRTLKQRPLKVKKYATVGDDKNFCDIYEVFDRYIGEKINLTIEAMDEDPGFSVREDNDETQITGKLKISTTVEEFKNKDIIDICAEYDEWLSSIVNECIKLFG
jgi:hypothetical protein